MGWGGEWGGRGGEDGGAGDRGWGDLSPHQSHHIVNTCAAKSAWNPGKHTKQGIIGGWADGRGVLASIAIELDRECFRKLLGKTETEFVRNLKCLVDFEL